MAEWAANNWILGMVLTGGVSLALSAFAKFCPKEKLVGWIKPPCIKLGKTISKILILRLGASAAARVEEGIIVTVLTVIGQAPLYIRDGLLDDNKERGKKGGK